MTRMSIYDTTLRDGAQGEGINFSVDDMLSITALLDDLGVAYVEGGWPGSNPRDEAFFARAVRLKLANVRLSAFGSTCRSGRSCDDDPNIQALLKAGVGTLTIFGKSSGFHVTHVLGISPTENLDLIEASVRYLKGHVDEVIFDAEHFFDGYAADPAYAIATLTAAVTGGADRIVLCDTNGGTMPHDIAVAVTRVLAEVPRPLGIHAHNDAELAVANSIAAVRAGVTMVQGTVNGLGERCGNANLVSIVPTLETKMGIPCLPAGRLARLTRVARTVDEIANRKPFMSQPYVGRSAFAHKGGVHASAVMKDPRTYEHIDPETVGNRHRVLVSDLSGRATVVLKARELGIELAPDDPAVDRVLARLKDLESEGYQFEGADASFKLLIDRMAGRHPRFFTLRSIGVNID
ncbi:MAG: citramalate synthase, partial [Acidobacteria bacterium]|nr:citramalate synthase [Acidobacteriota bacterium]